MPRKGEETSIDPSRLSGAWQKAGGRLREPVNWCCMCSKTAIEVVATNCLFKKSRNEVSGGGKIKFRNVEKRMGQVFQSTEEAIILGKAQP